MEEMALSQTLTSLLRFFKTGIWLPVVLPFVLYRYILYRQVEPKRRKKLQNKVVLITGASSGLGEALAHVFYNAGSKVILAARRVEQLERVKNDLLSSNSSPSCHQPVVFPIDISDLAAIPQKVKAALEIHGTIDILVNNSGVSSRSDVASTHIDVDMKIMLVNYFGHVALTKAILSSMIERRTGHIVTVSSIQGRFAIPYRSSYTASKHALIAFFDALRAEIHDKNIQVTVVSPGYINTNLSVNALKGDGSQHQVLDPTTLSGMPANVAAERVVRAIVRGDKELLLASWEAKIALYLRVFWPNLFFYLMAKRASKGQTKDSN